MYYSWLELSAYPSPHTPGDCLLIAAFLFSQNIADAGDSKPKRGEPWERIHAADEDRREYRRPSSQVLGEACQPLESPTDMYGNGMDMYT